MKTVIETLLIVALALALCFVSCGKKSEVDVIKDNRCMCPGEKMRPIDSVKH